MKTIVIVEDEVVNALLLQEMLKVLDVNILVLSSGKGLLETIEEKDVHLILMDVRLPGLNGYELTRLVKDKYPNIPIIIQTAYAFQSDIEKAENAGCDAYLSKPIDKNKLIELINGLIKLN